MKLTTDFIDKPKALDGDSLCFLNLTRRFEDWNDKHFGMLWAYNLNYMDYLLQADVDEAEGKTWIDRFLDDLPARTIGLDPYPTALRLMNWAKFFAKHYPDKDIPDNWRTAYYNQLLQLERRREFHLLGNHLLEDAYALYIGWIHMGEHGKHLSQARQLLLSQLEEQTLSDGAHYEQSPMYHCILLDRLLDTINFATADSDIANDKLREYAQKQLGWLETIAWKEGGIPLFGDSAIGIAPTPVEIFDYARRLGLSWTAATLGASGYRKLQDQNMEAVVDVGNITATYQPGHTHSDLFSFELHINNQPLVADTGISTYEKNARRQYERSYQAHNVAQIADEEPFEVWGGFRVGRADKARIIKEAANFVEAERDGRYKNLRTFEMGNGVFTITDLIYGHQAIARIHLAPGIKAALQDDGSVQTELATFRFQGEDVRVSLTDCTVSTDYNNLQPSACIEVQFEDTLNTLIQPAKRP